MRIEAINSFAHLVRAGSYPGASEQLFLSPTTIYGHVKSLEEELQATLVHFNGRKLELSRAGARFFVFAEKMLEERARMERDILGLARADVARLRISSLHGPSIHLLPPVVAAFRERHPDVTVTVTANGVGECEAALVSGQADIAILNDLHEDELSGPFGATPLYEDTVELVIRADYYAPPDVRLLETYPLALQPNTSGYRQQLERWARREGITLKTAYEHTSFDGLLSFVMQGGCIGMVGGYVPLLTPVGDRLRVLELPNFSLRRRVMALHPARLDPLTAEFLEFFREFFGAAPLPVASDSSNDGTENL
jgi:DNA-binding transcriptional LysR family regulator